MRAGGEEPGLVCQCEQCRIKKTKLQVQQPKQRVKHYARLGFDSLHVWLD